MYEEEVEEHRFPVLLIVSLIAGLLVYIAFLATLYRTLRSVGESRRTIRPWTAWAMLIPLVNVVWQFFLVGGIADSLRAEFSYRKIEVREDRPGFDLGMLMCLFSIASALSFYSPVYGMVAGVFWIAYWIKIVGLKRKLGSPRMDFSEWDKRNKMNGGETKSNLEDFREMIQ